MSMNRRKFLGAAAAAGLAGSRVSADDVAGKGATKAELPTPALLVDLDAFEANLKLMAEHCRKAGIGPTTYYRWKALQEDPVSSEQLRISELETEVARLKTLVAELALDRRMLQEALEKSHDLPATPPHRRQIMRPIRRVSTSRGPGAGPAPFQPLLRARLPR